MRPAPGVTLAAPTRKKTGIIASRIPMDDVEKRRFCVTYGREKKPGSVARCRFSHRIKLGKEWREYVYGVTNGRETCGPR